MADSIAILDEDLIAYRDQNPDSLQGGKENSPTHFLQVFYEIQEKLIDLGLYNKYRSSFINMVIMHSIEHLDSLTKEESFISLYDQLKTDAFKRFQIDHFPYEKYLDKRYYEKVQAVMLNSPTGYLLMSNDHIKKNANYFFPYSKVKEGSNIILYAAGKVGKMYYSQIICNGYCNIIDWVDKEIGKNTNSKVKVPDEVNMMNCDYVVIALESETSIKAVKDILIKEYELEEEKIVW